MARGNSWPTRFSILLWLLVLLVFAPASVFAQASRAVALHVTSEVPNRLELSVGDIAAFPRKSISVTDDKGARAEYAGVPVSEILEKAGAPLGKELKGPN